MALRFCDSFKHYAAADILAKWTTSATALIASTSGRWGTACLNLADDGRYVTKSLDAQATWIVGFGFRFTETGDIATPLIQFLDGAIVHVRLMFDESLGIFFFHRGTTEIGVRTTTSLAANVWHYIEAKVTIGDAPDGVASLKINGVDVLTQTGLDTRNAGNATANIIKINGINNQNTYFDDLYICDGSGAVNNDYLGDIKVECLLPTADGATADWTALSGADYTNVDEALQDGDTTYISSSTANQVDTFAMGNLATSAGTIKGVQYLLMARKDDAGSRSVAPVARPVSTDRVGTTASLADTYAYVREIAELNPEDSAAWEIADINGMEYGVKLIA